MTENYERLEPENPGYEEKRYCSRVEGTTCFCNVGGEYPSVPKFDLKCTNSHTTGCLASEDLSIIPSTNTLSKDKPPRYDPPAIALKERRDIKVKAANKIAKGVDVNDAGNCMMVGPWLDGDIKVAWALKIANRLKNAVTVVKEGEEAEEAGAAVDLSREKKMSEIWKIPPSFLPCKEYITTILAATPNGNPSGGSQGLGKIVQKKWNKPAGDQDNLINEIIKQGFSVLPFAPVKENDIRQCNALVVVLGQNLDFSDPTVISVDSAPDNWTRIMDLEIAGNKKQSYAVRLYSEDYGSYSGFMGIGGHRDVTFGVNRRRTTGPLIDRSSTLVDLENIKVRQNHCVTTGGKLTVTSTKANPKGPDLKVEKWDARYGGDTLPALIFVPGIDIVNPTPTYDSLILYRDNLPFYAMPSWMKKNQELLKKNGFEDPLSWMQVVILDLSYKYLNARQFQSLFTYIEPLVYGAVMQFYMGVDDDSYYWKNIVVPVDVEAQEKEGEEQEKMYQKYLKKAGDGTEYIEIPWDTVKEIKDLPESKCGEEQCPSGDYSSSESCALCNLFLTPFLASLFWTAKRAADSGGEFRRLVIEDRFKVPRGDYMYVNSIYTFKFLQDSVSLRSRKRLRRAIQAAGGERAWKRLSTNEQNAFKDAEAGTEWLEDWLTPGFGVYVRYGTHSAANGETYCTPAPNLQRVNVPGGACWANTIFKLVMYLSKHICRPAITAEYVGAVGWKAMSEDKNNISTFALLNHSVPWNRQANRYQLTSQRDRLRGRGRGRGYTQSHIFCPPKSSQRREWADMQSGNFSVGVLKYFDFEGSSNVRQSSDSEYGVTRIITGQGGYRTKFQPSFPNDSCWKTDMNFFGRGSEQLDWINLTKFKRGSVDNGSTNLWDYSAGGNNGSDPPTSRTPPWNNDPDANPPFIWDKCCAESCHKPCSDAERSDGCVNGTMPAEFYPRFKFKIIEEAWVTIHKLIDFPSRIPPLIEILEKKTGVVGAGLEGDPYFLDILATTDFSRLWTKDTSILSNLTDMRNVKYDFNINLTDEDLRLMLNPVVDAMECQSYNFKSMGQAALNEGEEYYVTTVRGRPAFSPKTWGPFTVKKMKITSKSSRAMHMGVVVLNSNNVFGANNELNDSRYYLHNKNLPLNISGKQIQLTSKIKRGGHSVTIVGYKSFGSEVKPEVPQSVVDPKIQPLPARFSEANKSKVNYFIVDINWQSKMNNAYVLIPIASLFALGQEQGQGAGAGKSGVRSNDIKTVFNVVRVTTATHLIFKNNNPYSVSGITNIFAADLETIRDPNSGQAVDETDTGGGKADLKPSQVISDGGSEPVWPLFLAVALCVAAIVIWKRVAR